MITIKRAQRGFELTEELILPHPPERLFPFFADAANLETLTPQYLNFNIETSLPIDMHEGAIIDYRLRLHGMPIRWRTEISTWEPPHRFVDRQVKGPYRWWIHEHTFESIPEGTRMTDRVRYHTWLSPLLHPMLVRPDLTRIFTFRTQQLQAIFEDGETSA